MNCKFNVEDYHFLKLTHFKSFWFHDFELLDLRVAVILNLRNSGPSNDSILVFVYFFTSSSKSRVSNLQILKLNFVFKI